MVDSIRITSLDDPRIADYRNVRDADLRGGGGLSPRGPGAPSNKLFMAESEPVIRRLIESQRHPLKSLFVSEERWDAMADVGPGLAARGVPIYIASMELMRAVAGYRHHGGALAAGFRPLPSELDPARLLAGLAGRQRFCVLLVEGITHVDNIGAIFRNAAALGAAGVVLDRACADPLFRKAIRVSMGHVFHVPWAIAEDLGDAMVLMRAEHGAKIVAAESASAAASIDGFNFPPRCGVLFGAEKHGVSAGTLARVDHIVEIPMARSGTSLNVAVASAIFLHAWRRATPLSLRERGKG